MYKKTYSEKLRDPRWQKKRLQIFDRDNFTCVKCGNDELELHVHHKKYIKNREPWEYSDKFLETLCHVCHNKEHASSTEELFKKQMSSNKPVEKSYEPVVKNKAVVYTTPEDKPIYKKTLLQTLKEKHKQSQPYILDKTKVVSTIIHFSSTVQGEAAEILRRAKIEISKDDESTFELKLASAEESRQIELIKMPLLFALQKEFDNNRFSYFITYTEDLADMPKSSQKGSLLAQLRAKHSN
jgi:hypothetical protein